MVSQAPLKNGHAQSTTGATSRIASFGRDCWRLIELQSRLVQIDLREFARRAAGPIAAMVVASVFSLAAVGVGLAGLAELLAEYTELSNGGALAIVAAVALVLTGAIIALAVTKLRTAAAPLERSKEELIANVQIIVAALQRTTDHD